MAALQLKHIVSTFIIFIHIIYPKDPGISPRKGKKAPYISILFRMGLEAKISYGYMIYFMDLDHSHVFKANLHGTFFIF